MDRVSIPFRNFAMDPLGHRAASKGLAEAFRGTPVGFIC